MDLLEIFENKRPEIVFEWKDNETEAEGWVVINSLRGGAAGGGTRMRKGLDKKEVESLAKTMEVKFTVSGPPIGGAKSGINFDPRDPRKEGVLRRWYSAVLPLLKGYYGTGGDLNIDEVNEVIPITQELGLWHPQEGVVNGHFKARENEKIQKIGQLRLGVSKVVEDPHYSPDTARKYVIADLITGYGVAESVIHFYNHYKEAVDGKTAIIQGWGNVASSAAYYLAQNGVKVVGIIDRSSGLINESGFSFEEIRTLFNQKTNNSLTGPNIMSYEEVNRRIWDVKADIFIPAAASRLITHEQAKRMIDAGLKVIACGANVPFADNEIFVGPIADFVDQNLSLIPDFISNCGMARTFAYLMSSGIEISDQSIFEDVSNTIKNALTDTLQFNETRTGIAKKSLHAAVKELVK